MRRVLHSRIVRRLALCALLAMATVPLSGCAALGGLTRLADTIVNSTVNTATKTVNTVTPKASWFDSRKRAYRDAAQKQQAAYEQLFSGSGDKSKRNFNVRKKHHSSSRSSSTKQSSNSKHLRKRSHSKTGTTTTTTHSRSHRKHHTNKQQTDAEHAPVDN